MIVKTNVSRAYVIVLITLAAIAAVATGVLRSKGGDRAEKFVAKPGIAYGEHRADVRSVQIDSLVLTGTVAASNASGGYALIREGNAPSQFVAVGEIVVPAVKLTAVHPDHVMLDVNGQARQLWLTPSSYSVISATPSDVDHRSLDEMFSVRYSYEDGIHRGFVVFPGSDPTWLARLSLLPGDLVIAINGEPLDQPDSGAARLAALRTLDVADVTIVRFDEPQTMRVKVKTAAVIDPADGEVGAATETDAAFDDPTQR